MRALTIGRLAAAAGTNLETVRYYERIGLMPRPQRSQGGHRHYAAEHARRLRFIRRARELGFGIQDIQVLLALAEPGRRSCGDVRNIASAHLRTIRSKIADLAQLEDILERTIAECSGRRSPICPVLDMLDAAIGGPNAARA